MSDASAYERLAVMIQRELELVGTMRLDELEELRSAKSALIGSLPTPPPASALPTLARCSALQQRVTVEVLRAQEAVLAAVGEVARAQRMASRYAPPRTRPAW